MDHTSIRIMYIWNNDIRNNLDDLIDKISYEYTMFDRELDFIRKYRANDG